VGSDISRWRYAIGFPRVSIHAPRVGSDYNAAVSGR